MLKKILLIVNPASGDRRAGSRLRKVLKLFGRRNCEVAVRLTGGPGHATTIARDEGPGYDAVVGAGGDGTLNEVLNGMAGSPIPLGLIPWGTGNVFAKEMRFPRGLKKLVKTIVRGQGLRFDLGNAGGRLFLLMASAGFDAAALRQVEGSRWKRLLGRGTYGLGALKAFLDYRHSPIDVVLDSGQTDRGTWVLVSNTRLYGAFFKVQPAADPTDGLLDVFVFRDQGRWAFLGFLYRMVTRTLFGPRGAVRSSLAGRHGFHRARTVELTSAASVPFQVDGDPEGDLPLKIEAVPGALTVLLPRKTVRRLAGISDRSHPPTAFDK